MRKKLITASILLSLSASVLSIPGALAANSKQEIQVISSSPIDPGFDGTKAAASILPLTNPFDEEKQNLPKSISAADLAKMEAFYNQAIKLQDEIDKLWKQYGDILGKYEEFPSFQEAKKDFPPTLSSDELKKLEELYNQISKLKKEGKSSEADPLWDQYYNILSNHYNTLHKNPLWENAR
ncbi:hypothetical protein [Paenibacillus tyrfis]|uniref:hypothetical protein n=1 Tax=Paenibacillus tyrfis TaxID=1501230 RepID=UPI00209C7028|nr:hypothetical protein [Paenibacillus tyrfis]MCP1311602.1 hypothetical protein [Paenibacillus tyrfis]